MVESYANYPFSVSEMRSRKSGDASDWSPRDMLISVLRDIDTGVLNPESMVIVFRKRRGSGYKTDFYAACPDLTVMTGLLEGAKLLAWRNLP